LDKVDAAEKKSEDVMMTYRCSSSSFSSNLSIGSHVGSGTIGKALFFYPSDTLSHLFSPMIFGFIMPISNVRLINSCHNIFV
jgi:hypothetical protein